MNNFFTLSEEELENVLSTQKMGLEEIIELLEDSMSKTVSTSTRAEGAYWIINLRAHSIFRNHCT